jgi:protoporphyrinogen/coproporphyrinogen III oxidase
MLRSKKKNAASKNGSTPAAPTSDKPRRSTVSSFLEGMETLPRRLAKDLNIQLGSTGVRIGKTIQAPATIVTTPAYHAAEIVENFNADLAALLRQVQYAPIVIAAVSIADETLQMPIRGFGFLVPRTERLHILGAVFNSSLFLDRAPNGRQLVTCFIGGALNPEAFDWPDARVWDVVCAELKSVLKLQVQPDPISLARYPRAIPQYGLHHLQWRREFDAEMKRCPGLFITGNYVDGVSVPACMEQGDRTAQTVTEYLRGRR